MFLVFSIFIFIASLSKLIESHEIDGILENFIVDVPSSLYSPSAITALVCVSDEATIDFSRKLSRNYMINDVRMSLEGLDPTRLKTGINHRNIIVLDLDCLGALDILIKANQARMFVAPTKWLLLQDVRSLSKETNKSSNLNKIIENDDISWINDNFRNFEIFPDSEMIVARRINDDLIRVLSPYRPSPQRDLILEDRGLWSRREGFSLRDRFPSSRRRLNLHKTKLKSCLVMTNIDTLNHLEDYQGKLVDAVTKANYPWIFHLMRRMNATVNFTTQHTWGYHEKNGSWSGMIGLLDRREIDLGGTATFLVSDRIGVVEYLQLYTPTGSKFLFRRPPLSYVSNLFTLPFQRSVWITICILLIISIGVLYAAMKWEYKMKSDKGTSQPDWSSNNDEDPSFSNNLLVVIGAVFQQGFSYEARAVSTRIIVLILLLTALSLYASYTANIVALLQSTSTSINTPRDLVTSPLKLGVYDIVYSRYYFQAAQDPERKELYETAIKGKKDVWMSLEEGISRMRKGLFAFHSEVGAGYQLMQETFEEDEKCGIHEVDFLKVINPSLIVQRQSPYLEIFRVGALWIRETGLQYREISRLFTEKPVCHGHNRFLSVGIIDCYAAFMAMIYGTAASIAVLLIEIIWKKWCSSQTEDVSSEMDLVE